MPLISGAIAEPAIAACLFSLVFLLGKYVHPLRSFIPDRRVIISFCAGMSVAYVFVRVMPELQGARHAFKENVASAQHFEGIIVYFTALIGFLVFYGLENQSRRLQQTSHSDQSGPAFRLDVGGFSAYVLLMSYLLVNNIEETSYSLLLYAVAIALHFLAVDHGLRREHGTAYDRYGRFVLAGMAILGWIIGLLLPLPPYAIALIVAFTSGGIIVNSMLEELSHDKDGRFVPFLFGSLLYGGILVPFG